MHEAKHATIQTGPLEEVDIGVADELNINELHRRVPEFQGRHYWTIAMVWALADPELALDHMVLDGSGLVGYQPIRCMFCQVPYPRDGTGPSMSHSVCPGPPDHDV